MKFNKGDTVRCNSSRFTYVEKDKTYTISEPSNQYVFVVGNDGCEHSYDPAHFELVKAGGVISTIADLKTGMRVITNVGREAIFVEEAEHSVAAIVYAGESSWDRAFLSTDGYRCHIKEVYAAPKHAASYLNVSARGELLWSAVDAAKVAALEAAKAKLAEAQAAVAAAEAALK